MRPAAIFRAAALTAAVVMLTGIGVEAAWSADDAEELDVSRHIDVTVTQENGNVEFEFSFERSEEKIAAAVVDLSVYLSGKQLLWAIKATTDNPTAARLTYGVVPKGFRQTAPAHGSAPPLKKGMVYELNATTVVGRPFHTFTYEGK